MQHRIGTEIQIHVLQGSGLVNLAPNSGAHDMDTQRMNQKNTPLWDVASGQSATAPCFLVEATISGGGSQCCIAERTQLSYVTSIIMDSL